MRFVNVFPVHSVGYYGWTILPPTVLGVNVFKESYCLEVFVYYGWTIVPSTVLGEPFSKNLIVLTTGLLQISRRIHPKPKATKEEMGNVIL